LKTKPQTLTLNALRVVSGCSLGVILLITLLILLQASSNAGPPAAAAPSDVVLAYPLGSSHSIGSHIANSTRQIVSETLYLDTFDPGNDGVVGPITSAAPLSIGEGFKVTVSGTFSVWSGWSSVCKGTPEDWPQTPSPDTTNGKVGLDPEYIFAVPTGSSICSNLGDPPYRQWNFEMSFDNGATWLNPVPLGSTYNSAHVYTYVLTGEGFPALFRFVDTYTRDNYGIITIRIEGPVPIYLITGTVRDQNDAPIKGVTISAGSGSSDTTDKNGAYSIIGLSSDLRYTLTPNKRDYSFSPARRFVDGPQDATDQNFIGVKDGGLPTSFLDLPLDYGDSQSNFRQALRNWNNDGRINSWLDHKFPDYSRGYGIWRYKGTPHTNNKKWMSGVPCYENYCYDGHNGIDFKRPEENSQQAVASPCQPLMVS